MPANTILTLLFGRILFAALALSVLTILIISMRKNSAPSIRSWFWALCIPALIVPFEHSAVALAQKIELHTLTSSGIVFELWQPILSYIWLTGFVAFSIKTRANNRRNLHKLLNRELNGCAAYFHKWRSHIYLPPNFHMTYSPAEQDMLLAHERQHILQHDPALFRFLQIVLCVFWFNPPLHKAISLIRQDRELLCDERVTQGRCKTAYGALLLREAQISMPGQAIAGMATESECLYERIAACVIPFRQNKKNIVVVLGMTAIILATGIMGFLIPAVESPVDIRVYLVEDASLTHIDGAEIFFSAEPDGIVTDQKNIAEYALSAGLKPEQRLYISVITGKRPTLTSYCTVSDGFEFAIHELEAKMPPFSYDSKQNVWRELFKLI